MLRITSLLQLYIIVLNQTFTEQACDRILAVFFTEMANNGPNFSKEVPIASSLSYDKILRIFD